MNISAMVICVPIHNHFGYVFGKYYIFWQKIEVIPAKNLSTTIPTLSTT